MKNRITNTSKQAKEDPLMVLAEHAFTPNPIERSEARGQQELCNSEVLPIKELHGKVRGVLEKAGVVFGDIVKDDEIFQNVELPRGWKKVATDHSMWSKLIDDKGRERASIFYKAAFYDRSAHISLSTRYTVSSYENDEYAVVKDGEKVIFKSQPFELVNGKPTYESRDERDKEAENWLNKNYPDWQNPSKYFD